MTLRSCVSSFLGAPLLEAPTKKAERYKPRTNRTGASQWSSRDLVAHDNHPKGSAEQHHHRHHRLSGAFHVGNGWEWGLLGLLFYGCGLDQQPCCWDYCLWLWIGSATLLLGLLFMVVDWISNPVAGIIVYGCGLDQQPCCWDYCFMVVDWISNPHSQRKQHQ